MSLGGEQMPNLITLDSFRRLAEHSHGDPESAATLVTSTVDSLRGAWRAVVAGEAEARFPALAAHYEQRLTDLALCRT